MEESRIKDWGWRIKEGGKYKKLETQKDKYRINYEST
jgi:hypothetical protein